jgi:hypothetical protein
MPCGANVVFTLVLLFGWQAFLIMFTSFKLAAKMIRRMAGLAGGASDTVFNYFGLVKVLHVWFGGRNFARPGSV